MLGINGAQGSGKSTLAAFLVEQLASQHGLRALAVSLDDFYLGRAARAELARCVHPLLATRGVPGTHDAARGIECLCKLRNGEVCALPAFSKAIDDTLPSAQDRLVTEKPDLVLFEGWCVGTPPQDASALAMPVNDLERGEDADGGWRRFVNQQLAGIYAEWFAELDALVYLRVPGWEQVRMWRAQQERETAARHQGQSLLLDDAARERFLLHYQRLTHHALQALPAIAGAVLDIDEAHEVSALRKAQG